MMKKIILAASLVFASSEATNLTALASCHDIVKDDVNSSDEVIATCARNVLWAKNVGIVDDPKYYTNFVDLSKFSDLGDFQCALWHKSVNGINANGTEGHGCMHPCTPRPLHVFFGSVGPICKGDANCELSQWGHWAACTAIAGGGTQRTRVRTIRNNRIGSGKPCVGDVSETVQGCKVPRLKATEPDSQIRWPGPWYMWVLLVLGFVCGLALLAWAFSRRRTPSKKKRSVKKSAASSPDVAEPPAITPQAQSLAMPAPVATSSIPLRAYTYQAVPGAPVSFATPIITAYAPPMVGASYRVAAKQ